MFSFKIGVILFSAFGLVRIFVINIFLHPIFTSRTIEYLNNSSRRLLAPKKDMLLKKIFLNLLNIPKYQKELFIMGI
jgi:hypothetical protein